MNCKKKRQCRQRRGVITVLIVVLLVVALGIAALAVDAGRLYAERQRVRAAADAAAMAAAIELFDATAREEEYQGTGPRHSAMSIARANGYDDGELSTVSVHIPPQTGQYAGHEGYVEVVIESYLARSFSAIFGRSSLPVSGRAVAAGTLEPTQASVLILDPKGKNSLELKKGGAVLETTGDIVVNSKNKKAAKIDKKSLLIAENLLFSGSLDKKLVKKLEPVVRAEIHQRVDPTPDPFADLSVPQGELDRKADDFRTVENGRNVYRLQPGTYKDSLKFEKGDVVTMQPGVYVMEKGLALKKDAILEANQVTLVFTKKPSLKIDASSVTITPQRTGPYAGVSVFLDPAKKGKVEFKKDAELNIRGILYAPHGEIKFKSTDMTLEPDDDDWDWDGTFDDEKDDADGDEELGEGRSTFGRLAASLIARKLKIDKRSHILVQGSDIPARRPMLRLVE